MMGHLSTVDTATDNHDDAPEAPWPRALERLDELTRAFARSGEDLLDAAATLVDTSIAMIGSTDTSWIMTNVVSGGTAVVDQSLQQVQGSAQDLTSTIGTISSGVQAAAAVSSAAVRCAHEANATIAKLSDSSTEIGKVIKLIASVAQQTNLLALNAAIEAARAGEAGKGFAIVAAEVKSLARETAKASGYISELVETIQADTRGVIDTIVRLTGITDELDRSQHAIVGAVSAQQATVRTMEHNLQEATENARFILHFIQGVREAAACATGTAQSNQDAALKVAALSAAIREVADEFARVLGSPRGGGR